MNKNGKTALLAGASGLVGKELLQDLLASPDYEKVIILTRKKLDISHSKLVQMQVDFDNLDLENCKADHVFCTLGTTIKKAGSKEAFRKVDMHYPIEIAKQCLKSGSELFAIVTSKGATPESTFFYQRVKGDVETSLTEMGYKHLGIFQPSMLLGNREEKRLGERLGQVVMQWLNFLIPKEYKAIGGDKVASAMIEYAKRPKKGLSIISSGQMMA